MSPVDRCGARSMQPVPCGLEAGCQMGWGMGPSLSALNFLLLSRVAAAKGQEGNVWHASAAVVVSGLEPSVAVLLSGSPVSSPAKCLVRKAMPAVHIPSNRVSTPPQGSSGENIPKADVRFPQECHQTPNKGTKEDPQLVAPQHSCTHALRVGSSFPCPGEVLRLVPLPP
mmetsp:Transcript_9608/g.14802  ORF Transcript_9608/g.14802 Transcript_9608/m.14802 type:complete len:170 (+) Transcript_9608:436-945(+)